MSLLYTKEQAYQLAIDALELDCAWHVRREAANILREIRASPEAFVSSLTDEQVAKAIPFHWEADDPKFFKDCVYFAHRAAAIHASEDVIELSKAVRVLMDAFDCVDTNVRFGALAYAAAILECLNTKVSA